MITLWFGAGTSFAQTCNCCTASPQLSFTTSPPRVGAGVGAPLPSVVTRRRPVHPQHHHDMQHHGCDDARGHHTRGQRQQPQLHRRRRHLHPTELNATVDAAGDLAGPVLWRCRGRPSCCREPDRGHRGRTETRHYDPHLAHANGSVVIPKTRRAIVQSRRLRRPRLSRSPRSQQLHRWGVPGPREGAPEPDLGWPYPPSGTFTLLPGVPTFPCVSTRSITKNGDSSRGERRGMVGIAWGDGPTLMEESSLQQWVWDALVGG